MPRHVKRVSFLDLITTLSPTDWTGNPWTGCMCGSTWILLPVAFEREHINSYGTHGFCCECGAKLTVPTPTKENADDVQ